MANRADRADKRQQFRFWNPFWGNASTAPSSSRLPSSAPRPSPTNQPKPQAATHPTSAPPTPPIKKNTSRTPSRSPSSSSSSPSSSPAKQYQPRRVSHIPSSPLPSPTQSPSRRSSRLDQVKQKTKDIDAQNSLEASNQQGTKQEEEKMFDKEPIEPKAQDPKTIDDKPTSQASNNSNVEKENDSKDLEQIEPKSIPFHPLISDKPKPIETVIPDKNPTETDEQKGPKNHGPKPQLELDASTNIIEQVSETRQLEENKQTRKENHDQEKSIPDMNHQENKITKDDIIHPEKTTTIKEIANPMQDGDPKETIKEITQPSISDVDHLNSNNQSKTHNSMKNNNNNHSDDEDCAERENPLSDNPKQKEKIVGSRSSSRTSFQKDIKDGISKLVQTINSDNQFNPGSDRGTSIITLAGDNKGASMYIGEENEGHNSTFTGRARNGKDQIEIKNDEEDLKTSANVNSNVQSINNSVLQESRCDTRDPGVHLKLISSRMKNEKMKKREATG